MPSVRTVTKVGLVSAFGLGVVYDVIAYSLAGNPGTISRVILEAVKEFPVIGLLGGILMGHLFWPQTPPPDAK